MVAKGGEEIESIQEVTEEFNSYFASVFTEENVTNVPRINSDAGRNI